jgi:cytoskeletal protein CcmA (bactofilin family)
MFNKRRDEEPPRPYSPPSPPAVAQNPVEVKKETTSLSSMPMGRVEPDSQRSSATIGKAVKIIGQIFSKEDLYMDGDLEGSVEALEHKLTVGPNGTVHAGIKAREVVALGTIQGNVEATDKIEIRKDAKLVGDIRTARIIIEDGAYFKGSIDIVRADSAKPAASRPQPAPPAMAASNATPISAGASESKR